MKIFHLVCECGSCLLLTGSSDIAANSSVRAGGFPLQNAAFPKRLQEFPLEKAFSSTPCGHVPQSWAHQSPQLKGSQNLSIAC